MPRRTISQSKKAHLRPESVLDFGGQAKKQESKALEQAEAKLVYPYPEDNSKQLLVWVGAIFFVLAIGFVWVMNTKKVFQESVSDQPVDSASTADWAELRDELSSTMAQVKTGIEGIKNAAQTATSTATSTLPVVETATTTATSTITLSPEQLQNLKDDLKKLDKDL